MKRTKLMFAAAGIAAVLASCSDPRDSALPADIAQLETIQPQLKKLTEEERGLVMAYFLRKQMGGLFDKSQGGIQPGTTIRAAIEDQKKFKAELLEREAAQKALKEKLAKEREAAFKAINDIILVTLVHKEVKSRTGFSGIELGKELVETIGFQNKGSKDIAGVKGRLVILDMFGAEVGRIGFSHDDAVSAGQTTMQKYTKSLNQFMNTDSKLAAIEEGKYTTRFEPEMIVFKDGTSLKSPDE